MFKYKAHKGSDLDRMSMSKRFSQEMVSSTLEAKWVAPGPRGPPEAMVACGLEMIKEGTVTKFFYIEHTSPL